MTQVSAVLLAAGESRRMGGVNKLELPVAGVPLLRRTATMLLAAPLQQIVVVLGHQADTARALLVGLPLQMVENPDYRAGQMTSVYQGLMALSQPCDGVMICLSDQPLLETADIGTLIGAFERLVLQRRCGAVLVPTYQGRRGNPIILEYRQRNEILRGDRNLGCKRLIEKNPELVVAFEMANDHVVVDLDTPEEYATLTGGWQWPDHREDDGDGTRDS